ncbi:VOC family protein [Candidatus Enterococcus ferrettii]|uniref:PhnB protein n=1 Tax=Candidatus Enterococcus ferrettii TaxID=2815324 RepID=A0ABV0ET05_9ENTE|nr:VOC family protein [Enterococcus sp. 665A]MBO1342614.1 VOC family protein [Enterococcus sp. 665A]
MGFSIFLNFDGTCREAVTFYAKVFNKKTPTFLTYGNMDASFDSNVVVSDKGKALIASTSLEICGTVVQFSDMPDNFEFIRGNSMALIVSFKTFEEAKVIFDRLAEGGSVFVPLTETANSYSLLADKYNINWQISVNGMA